MYCVQKLIQQAVCVDYKRQSFKASLFSVPKDQVIKLRDHTATPNTASYSGSEGDRTPPFFLRTKWPPQRWKNFPLCPLCDLTLHTKNTTNHSVPSTLCDNMITVTTVFHSGGRLNVISAWWTMIAKVYPFNSSELCMSWSWVSSKKEKDNTVYLNVF